MSQELEQILQNYGYEIAGRCRGSSDGCWVVGSKRGKSDDYGEKEYQVLAALTKRAGAIAERHFKLSVTRTALASRWVQDQIADGSQFLVEAGLAHFCALLRANDEIGDDYPELQLHSRSPPEAFQIPGRGNLAQEITRVRFEILNALQIASYEGRTRLTKSELEGTVCTRATVFTRSLVYLEERGDIKGARLDDIAITTAGELELEELRRERRTEGKVEIDRPGRTDTRKQYDVFISHASEDKQAFVRPLADRLVGEGLSVWYDDFTLKIGDSLRSSIDRGLRDSQRGIVVLSHAFFAKEWPQRELAGLFALATTGERKILPIWHEVTVDDLKNYSPMLADIKAVRSNEGLEAIVMAVLDVVKPVPDGETR